MDTLLRFLNRPVHLRPAGPRVRHVLWLLLAGRALLNVADWTTTAAVLIRAGFHEDNPLQAALLARGGLVALAGYKALVIADGVVSRGWASACGRASLSCRGPGVSCWWRQPSSGIPDS